MGAVNLAIVAFATGAVAPRDSASVDSLDRFLWLNVGLDVGSIAVGATMTLALCILDLQLTAHISRG